MRLTKLKPFIVIPALALILGTGCKGKEGCTDPYSENFDATAEVENNTCISPRDKFLGIYTINYQCSNGEKPEVSLIEVKAAPDNLTDILIYGLNGYSQGTRATVNKSELVIYESKNIYQTPWKDMKGTGNIVGGTITIQYQIGQPNNSTTIYYSCVATLSN